MQLLTSTPLPCTYAPYIHTSRIHTHTGTDKHTMAVWVKGPARVI